MVAEQRDDLLRLVHPHQPVVDEHAGQLVADRLVDKHGRNRAVDSARKAADDLAVPDLRADLLDLGLAELGHGPVARQPADMAYEICQQLAAVGRVHDFRMELRAVIFAFLVGDDREGRTVAGGDDLETGREFGDLVTMAHPHLVALAGLPKPVEQRAGFGHGQIGAPELAALTRFMPWPHLSAELLCHDLLTVADTEDRQAAVEQHLWRTRAALVAHACR